MTYVDTHAHLDAEEFDADRDDVIGRARESGVEVMICPGISAASSEAAVRLAQSCDEVFAAVGIQPNYCGEAAQGDWDRIARLVSETGVVGLGETGLDRHWDFTPLDVQQDYFDRHLRLAQQRDLPVIIHCREADAEVLAMLREATARASLSGVLHAFGGDEALAGECVAMGLYVSFAGPVTYKNKKFEPLRKAVGAVPDDRILLETDSPYLVPHPLRGKRKRNEPMHVIHTAECLAELRGVDLQTLARQTSINARNLFALS